MAKPLNGPTLEDPLIYKGNNFCHDALGFCLIPVPSSYYFLESYWIIIILINILDPHCKRFYSDIAVWIGLSQIQRDK